MRRTIIRTLRSSNTSLARFRDRVDLMLVDKQVWMAFARQSHHRIVEVLDPATHSLAIVQLDRDRHSALAERVQIKCLLPGFTWRRCLGTVVR